MMYTEQELKEAWQEGYEKGLKDKEIFRDYAVAERRREWSQYASSAFRCETQSVMFHVKLAIQVADTLLEEADSRFSRSEQEDH